MLEVYIARAYRDGIVFVCDCNEESFKWHKERFVVNLSTRPEASL